MLAGVAGVRWPTPLILSCTTARFRRYSVRVARVQMPLFSPRRPKGITATKVMAWCFTRDFAPGTMTSTCPSTSQPARVTRLRLAPGPPESSQPVRPGGPGSGGPTILLGGRGVCPTGVHGPAQGIQPATVVVTLLTQLKSVARIDQQAPPLIGADTPGPTSRSAAPSPP